MITRRGLLATAAVGAIAAAMTPHLRILSVDDKVIESSLDVDWEVLRDGKWHYVIFRDEECFWFKTAPKGIAFEPAIPNPHRAVPSRNMTYLAAHFDRKLTERTYCDYF